MSWSTTTVKEINWYSNAGLRVDIHFGHFTVGAAHTDVRAQILNRVLVRSGDL